MIERKLGEGGAGAVYLARDRETGEQVAYKQLFRVDAKGVLRLKREFRSLCAINHPHIIKLYDMGQAEGGWFLTMEYIAGTDLATYLAATQSASRRTGLGHFPQQLLGSFLQLARGVEALHQAGMLHRDLKPSNVLVADHRVVVLDFGLVRELGPDALTLTEQGSVAGTPAYMAPEQLMSQTLTGACDWYAFGVMLYEAICGQLPLDGPLVQVLRAKVEIDPPPIQTRAPWLRRDVSDLCMALLSRDPACRPGADQIIAVLSRDVDQPANTQTQNDATYRTETDPRAASAALFGRDADLAVLHDALRETEGRGSVFVHVRGSSGAGKTGLVEHFLASLEHSSEASRCRDVLILRSRCYELEAMPFKALDGVIDALVRHLSHLDDLAVAHVLPTHIASLTRLFPVLERVPVVARLVDKARPVPDAILDRQRAEAALRALLTRIAEKAPIVVSIDDLQWGDLDSARILRSWVQEPASAPILFVFTYRSEEITTSSCLARLLQNDSNSPEPRAVAEHTIELNLLGDADIRAMCEQRLGSLARSYPAVVDRIVREAHGSPFLASQLTVLADAKFARADRDWSNLTIAALVAQTSALLPPEAQTLLAVLALAGKPMPPKLALKAAGIARSGRALVHTLRGLNLVRTREVGGERMLAVHHDRVRASVRALLSEHESRRLHRRLLDVMQFSADADPDFLHTLALGAGDRAAALSYGHSAAERATASLAFERAADVYRRCVELAEPGELADLQRKLAMALACSGYGVAAAEAYLEATHHAHAEDVPELMQMAASHLLRSGRFEQGETLLAEVVARRGVHVPHGERGILAALVWERTRLKLRGMEFTLRAAKEVPPALLAEHDLCEELGTALVQVDPPRAALFHARGLRCALDAGEPTRVVHALCRAATNFAIEATPRATREADALLARAEQVASASGAPAKSVLASTRVFVHSFAGRYARVLELSEAALQELRIDPDANNRGNYYRRHATTVVRLGGLYMLGRYKTLCAELPALVEEARVTDNRSLLLHLAIIRAFSDEVLDTWSLAPRRLDQQRAELPKARIGLLHVAHMNAVAYTAAATGNYASAAECFEAHWDRYQRSPLSRAGTISIGLHLNRARLLLNQIVTEGEDRSRLARVREDLAWLSKRAPRYAGNRVAARLSLLARDRRRAIDLLQEGVAELDARGMAGEAARDRWALGALLGGERGDEQRDAAERTLRELGVLHPRRVLRAYYPEFLEAVR